MNTMQKIVAALLLTVATVQAQAAVMKVDFTYAGQANLSMKGTFTYNSTAGALVEESELLSFSYDVFKQNQASAILSVTLTQMKLDPNFNFNFVVAANPANTGFSTVASSQSWLTSSQGFQITGSPVKGSLTVNNNGNDNVSGNIAAKFGYTFSTVTTPVPEPETYGLMALGLGLIGTVVRRRKQA